MKKFKKVTLYIPALVLIVFSVLLFLQMRPSEYEESKVEQASVETFFPEEEENTEITKQTLKTTKEEIKNTLSNQNENTTKPMPKPENEVLKESNELTCSLSIRCDDVLENPEKLIESKESIIPENGIILSLTNVVFSDGESVFDVILREAKREKLHFEFEKTPMYNSIYIKGIGNLYEFDCGDCSGWTYKVNGLKPTISCSQYKLKNGDQIEFSYTCNYFETD